MLKIRTVFWTLWERVQSPIAVILEPKKIKSDTVSTVSPSICHELVGPDAMMFFECWVLSQLFHPLLSPSSRGALVPLRFLVTSQGDPQQPGSTWPWTCLCCGVSWTSGLEDLGSGFVTWPFHRPLWLRGVSDLSTDTQSLEIPGPEAWSTTPSWC